MGALRCSFNLSSKISSWHTNIFIITVNPVTLKPVYDPTFFVDWVFVLWGHEVVFDGVTTFQVYINPILLANVFVALTESLMVWDHNVRFWTTITTGPSLVVVTSFLLEMSGCTSPVWLYWWPSQDIYISLGIDADVSLPFAIHQVLNRLFLPCGTGCPPHYT